MSPSRPQAGFTLLELLVVLAILGILFAISPLAFQNLRNPAQEGRSLTAATLKTIRVRAIASSSAYRLKMTSDRLGMQADAAATCDSTAWVRKPAYDLVLPSKAIYKNTGTWEVCYTSRGTIASAPVVLNVTDHKNRVRGLKLYLGGAIGETP